MSIKLYTKVVLKDGRTATIVEVFENGKAYLVDVALPDGEWDTIEVTAEEIESIIV